MSIFPRVALIASIFLFSFSLHSQVKNDLFAEISLMKYAQNIQFDYDEVAVHQLSILNGFEFGYGIFDRWRTQIGFSRNTLFAIEKDNLEDDETKRIIFHGGIEYALIQPEQWDGVEIFVGAGYSFEWLKGEDPACFVPVGVNDFRGVNHQKMFSGYLVSIGINYALSDRMIMVIASRYRSGNVKVNGFPSADFYCPNGKYYDETFELLSKFSVRFIL